MRTLEAVRLDLASLGRPRFPCPAAPAVIEAWRRELQAWRQATPGGDDAYEALLEEWDAIEAGEATARRREDAGRAAGIPQRTARAALAAHDSAPLSLARAWLPSPAQWLVMLGGTGVGKSVAAAWALLEAMRDGATGLWVPATELATKAGGFDGQGFAQRLKGVGLLVVDDIGLEHSSEWGRAVLAEVLQDRHENGARTVLTTNLGGDAFRARIGERMADRVRSACMAREFTGASLRVGGAP